MGIQAKYLRILVFCMAIAIVSCKKQLDVNLHDSNGVGINELTGKDVFAQALATTATNKIGLNIALPSPNDNYDYATQWMGYMARTTSFAASGVQEQYETFSLNNSFSSGTWQSLYHNIYDYNFVIDIALGFHCLACDDFPVPGGSIWKYSLYAGMPTRTYYHA